MAWMVPAESDGLSSLALGGLTFMAEGVFARSSDSSITVWMLKQAKCFGCPGLRRMARISCMVASWKLMRMPAKNIGDVFVGCQSGMQGPTDRWVVLCRGLHREERHSTGERVGQSSDETPQRAIYREWARLMAGAAGQA